MKSSDQTLSKVQAVSDAAMTYSKTGACCAEAVVHACLDHLAPEGDLAVHTLVAGLCGGMGDRQATCGVFTGGAIALAAIYQARGESRDHRQLKAQAAKLHQQLSQEWDAQLCGDIRKTMGVRNWNFSQCRRLTQRGAERVAELVLAADRKRR